MFVSVCVGERVEMEGWEGGRRLYAIASAIVLNVDSWISLTYSGDIERKQVAEYGGGEGGGAIVINAADAAFCSASGQCSHFQKSPPNSLQIPAGLQNPFRSLCNFSCFPLFLDHHLLLTPEIFSYCI